MRILIHDFGAYPFSVQLSRELATRGHEVLYVYFDESSSIRGNVGRHKDDPKRFSSVGIGRDDDARRTSFVRRLTHDLSYALHLVAEARSFAPDLVVSADCPLISQKALQSYAARSNARFVYWLQDLFGLAIEAVIGRKNTAVARLAAAPFKSLEHHLLGVSDEVLAISPAFVDYVESTTSNARSAHLFPNWAPIETKKSKPSSSGLDLLDLPGGQRIIYSGTLGLKHNPDFLADLALAVREEGAHVVVVSQGPGRERLEALKVNQLIDNLFLLDFQPSENVPSVLASADVLVAILTADASAFSIPSKILAYLTVGRPILALMPRDNFSAAIVKEAKAGIVVDPANEQAAIQEVRSLLQNRATSEQLGRNARTFAEEQFDIRKIADRFEKACRIEQSIDLKEQELIQIDSHV